MNPEEAKKLLERRNEKTQKGISDITKWVQSAVPHLAKMLEQDLERNKIPHHLRIVALRYLFMHMANVTEMQHQTYMGTINSMDEKSGVEFAEFLEHIGVVQ